MNRQSVVDATDVGGTLSSHRLTYDLNGNRRGDTRNGVRIVVQGGAGSGQRVAEAGESTEVYGYDAANRVISSAPGGRGRGLHQPAPVVARHHRPRRAAGAPEPV